LFGAVHAAGDEHDSGRVGLIGTSSSTAASREEPEDAPATPDEAATASVQHATTVAGNFTTASL
jgi:hypothetical protein